MPYHMTSPDYWPKATRHLSKHCPTMKQLIATYKGEALQGRGDAFYTLARSIVGQQISVKAADSVWVKLESRVQDAGFGMQEVHRLDDAELRMCGLSGQKVAYLRAIAEYFAANQVTAGYFDAMDDAEVIKELTTIKGIGVWTAEMFLMFHLMRPDVFPLADIGLQKGMMRHYPSSFVIPAKAGIQPSSKMDSGLRRNDKRTLYTHMLALAEPWRPYRSVATWYLWRALDPVPVAY